MPEISRFYGISIKMLYDDHNPPHFHAFYNEHKVLIDINNVCILNGWLPKRALNMVFEWAKIHQKILLEEWNLAVNKKELFKIMPLK